MPNISNKWNHAIHGPLGLCPSLGIMLSRSVFPLHVAALLVCVDLCRRPYPERKFLLLLICLPTGGTLSGWWPQRYTMLCNLMTQRGAPHENHSGISLLFPDLLHLFNLSLIKFDLSVCSVLCSVQWQNGNFEPWQNLEWWQISNWWQSTFCII